MSFWLPVLVLCSSLATGVVIFVLREEQVRARTILNLAGATLKLVFVAIIAWGVLEDRTYEARWSYMPGLDFVLRVDPISLLFVTLSAILWLLTTIYAIAYLEGSPNRSRFFGFFSLCVTATMGIALAGNLITFFIFYEMLTVVTYPLVVHRGTIRALTAGRTYLLYTLAGGVLLLAGIVWLQIVAGPVEFVTGGALAPLAATHATPLKWIFALLVAGLGVKAAVVPLHSWLPAAMVAPAPVSALLHAVAVVKAGAYGIVRVVYDLYGLDVAAGLGLLTPLAVIASATIVYGSIRALSEREIKRRLAYSTVSHLSYIVLGIAIFGPLATIGGLVHLVHQGIMKITLFLCAGNLAETLHIHKVDQLRGVARRMPVTMTAFTVAAFGMIGVPPMAGFISKWHLGLGAIDAGHWWVLGVLAASSILNAMYFLPLILTAWFDRPVRGAHWPPATGRLETHWMLLVPAATTAVFTVGTGLFAGFALSPLALARLIVEDARLGFPDVGGAPGAAVWLLPIAIPLILVGLLMFSRSRRAAIRMAPWATIPALLLALFPASPEPVTLSWLLLETRLELDAPGRLFLFFTAALWTLGGFYARSYLTRQQQQRFFLFHLLASAGNLGLIISQDVASFYFFFALMTFAAYGLVVHTGSADAYRAGRVYMVMAVIGETMLLVGALLAVGAAGTLYLPDVAAALGAAPGRDVIMFLLLASFGIKAGAVPLHMWLPLAHPVAPTPASAVLSGCMIKAGLLGWLRFFPLGHTQLAAWGGVAIAAGLAAAFFGVLIGLTQRDPKTTLAYSSISQMGLINVAIGVGLSDPRLWDAALVACAIYAFHHGLAKGSLFLGVGVAGLRQGSRRLLLAGLALPALALAGAPFTSGAAAKLALKEAAAEVPFWADWLAWLLPIAAVGTTLLMGRFFMLTASQDIHGAVPRGRRARALWSIWIALVVLVAIAIWVVPAYVGLPVPRAAVFRPANIWTALWPIGAGALLFWAGAALARRWPPLREVSVAPGDIVGVAEHALGATRRLRRTLVEVPVTDVPAPPDPVESLASKWYGRYVPGRPPGRLGSLEGALTSWVGAGMIFLLIIGLVFASLVFS